MITTSMLTSSHSRRASANSQSGEAYRLIKEQIITLALPPAALIDEAKLMADLELGRTPIREALQRLALENLVVILPRRGTIVADLNMSDLQKIFEIRVDLELLSVRLAAQRATPAQIAGMEALFENADALLHDGDNYQLLGLDHQAHQLLAQAAQNEFLEETLDRLYNHVLRLWYVSLHRIQHLRAAI
jgi:DNA-binding GntR family transcriptional regulator